jgi:hypothetical protein
MGESLEGGKRKATEHCLEKSLLPFIALVRVCYGPSGSGLEACSRQPAECLGPIRRTVTLTVVEKKGPGEGWDSDTHAKRLTIGEA